MGDFSEHVGGQLVGIGFLEFGPGSSNSTSLTLRFPLPPSRTGGSAGRTDVLKHGRERIGVREGSAPDPDVLLSPATAVSLAYGT